MAHGVQPLPGGSYAVELEPHEEELLRSLAAELETLVAAEDPAVARLFPSAHRDDPAAEREYRRLVRHSLVSGRLEALHALRTSAGAETLSHDDAEAWCAALNDLRLVLGERLGVTEELYERELDPGDPDAVELSLYGWLTWLQASVVDALASRLPTRE
jgi:Domain of unknown function (DUF2017)